MDVKYADSLAVADAAYAYDSLARWGYKWEGGGGEVEKDRYIIDNLRGFIEKFSLFSNRSETQEGGGGCYTIKQNHLLLRIHTKTQILTPISVISRQFHASLFAITPILTLKLLHRIKTVGDDLSRTQSLYAMTVGPILYYKPIKDGGGGGGLLRHY